MKKQFFLFFLIMLAVLINGPVKADDIVRRCKIGLYIDVEHTGWCAEGIPVYGFFDMYLYVQPDMNGVLAVEFMIDYPDNVAVVETVLNEAFTTPPLGDPYSGMAIAYSECIRGCHWPMKQRMIVLDTEPSKIRLDAYPSENVAGLDYASCIDPMRPIFLLHRQTDFFVNQCSEAVWPAWLDSSTVDGPGSMTLYFSDLLSKEMAEDTNDYMFVNRLDSMETLAVAAVDLLADERSVRLTTASPFIAGHPYILEISDDADITKGANVLWTGAGLCPDLDIRAVNTPVGQDQDVARYPVQIIIRNNGGSDAGQFTLHVELKHRIKIGSTWYYLTLRTYERTLQGLSAGSTVAETFCTDLTGRGYEYIDILASIEYAGLEEDCYLYNNESFRQDYPRSPRLASAGDAPDDDGGWVQLSFVKSAMRHNTETAVFYEVYMRQTGTGSDDCGCEVGLCGEWELVRTFAAEGIYVYNKLVETPCDYTPSTPDCIFDYIVCGVEVTDTGDTLRHYSEIRTGYSAENNPPSRPQGFMGAQVGNDLLLSWDANPEDDLRGYRLSRWCQGPEPPAALIAEPVDTFYLDEDWFIGAECSYILYAVDFAGNLSESLYLFPSQLIGTMLERYTADIRGDLVRIEWMLSEIDPGITFQILRSQDGAIFEQIASIPAGNGTLEYEFEDREIAFGEEYIYRIEYEAGGARHVLLETEKIEIPELPLTLEQNLPNPFNPSTSISFYLPGAVEVRLDVFDVSGRVVKTLKNEHLAKGFHKIEWDGRYSGGNQAASGVYFYRLIAGKERLSRKMILLR